MPIAALISGANSVGPEKNSLGTQSLYACSHTGNYHVVAEYVVLVQGQLCYLQDPVHAVHLADLALDLAADVQRDAVLALGHAAVGHASLWDGNSKGRSS
jgi:hypothetical protein